MRNSLVVFLRNESNRNILALMTGTGLAQLIPLIVSPLLSHLYRPDQFGIFAIFTACVSCLSILATGRYELAIMLPRRDGDAFNITALAISLSCVACSILFATTVIFNNLISRIFGGSAIHTWIYYVPFAVFLNGAYSSLTYWSNRKKLYSTISHRRILHSGGASTVQLILGLVSPYPGGLIIGSICGQVLAACLMVSSVRRHSNNLLHGINLKRILVLGRRYKSCPLLLMPAHTLSAVSVQLPVIFTNALFGSSVSGLLMLAERVVGMPLALISSSIGDVFRQEISECYLRGENCRKKYISTLQKLTVIATLPFALLTLFAPPLFALIFGEPWRTSGQYAQLMGPMFYFRFISNPLSHVAIVAQKNRFELFWQVALLLCFLLVVVSQNFIQYSSKAYIIAFSGISVVFDIVNLAACYKFACGADLSEPPIHIEK